MRRGRLWLSVLLSSLLVATMLAPIAAVADEHDEGDDPSVLVFSATAGFRHASIPDGIAAVQDLGDEYGFEVDATEDAADFTDENLENYDAVVWLSTTGSVLNSEQQAAFESYIQNGGGYAGIHSASDTHYDWAWYGELVGAYFEGHPPGTQTADIWVTDQAHPSTEMLPGVWERHDEWYDFDLNPRGDVHVLATIDETSYVDQVTPGPQMGADHPIAWCQPFDGGRSWYTAGGHTSESFEEPLFLEHMAGGILWAAGEVEGDCGGTIWDNYDKVVLDDATTSPMMLDVADDGRVFYIERDGRVQIIDPDTNETTLAANLDVYTGQENGLLGITLDPDFADNDRVWLFHSPPNSVVGDEPYNAVSNFVMDGDTLDLDSQQTVLEIPHQRDECCHSAGDLEFGPDGELFISVGDDTNPFASDAYAPIDEREGREPWDAQRTSANTNDLRGKLLRIVPTEDGSDYTIPDDNLFEEGTQDTRPEIYAMGLRNPFRFSVDQTTGAAYLADYGPDAGSANPDRGPQNHVTWHIIDEAANIGWPYCIGPNRAYVDYDFDTGVSGDEFDCEGGPTNDSPNNTGLTELPPVQPATVFYNYSAPPEFPMLSGGAPMGGPRYEFDAELDSDIKWPASFDGSVVFGEWTTDRIYDFNLNDDASDVTQITEMLPDETFLRPMDFDFGPHDGALYMIEWGSGFGGNNTNSQVIRLEYTGEEDPDAPQVSASADPTSGDAPLEVEFTAEATSPVGDDIVSYTWDFGDGDATADGADASHTYTDPGTYRAEVTATDSEGRAGSAGVTITAEGDDPPPPAGDLVCLGEISDDFSGDSLDTDRWSEIVREDAGAYSVGAGSLTVLGADADIYGSNDNDAPNIFLQPLPDGAWQATAELSMEAYEAYQQAGLIVYGDDDNYAKMVLQGRDTNQVNPDSRIFQFIREEAGQPNEVGDSNTDDLGGDYPDTVFVRFTSDGSNLNASYSADGVDFTEMPETKSLDGIEDPRIGLFAISPGPGAEIEADFHAFTFSPDQTAEELSVSDEFDGDELDGCRWDRVVRYDPDTIEMTGGQLLIETPEGDIYQTPNDPVTNFILQNQPEGDWTVETRLQEELAGGFSQAGLMVHVDDDNYVKFDVIADDGQSEVNRIELRSEVDGQIVGPEENLDAPDNDGEWWLRLTKEGDDFSGQVSTDGEDWIDFPSTVTNEAAAATGGVGIFTLGVNGPYTTVAFDHFRLIGEDDPTDPVEPVEPTVEANLEPADPDGGEGWYVSPVTITLSSDDDATLEWRLAGDDEWITWTEPVTVDTDGVYDVEYRATVPGGQPGDPSVAEVGVGVGGNDFDPDELTVTVGDTVSYDLVDGFHNVVMVDDQGDEIDRSGDPSADWGGETYDFEASESGTFYFYCTPHATTGDDDPANWTGMVGTLQVEEPQLSSEVGEVSFQLDQTAPETSASVDGTTEGDAFVDEATVTLEASDETSGVAETHIRVAGDDDFDVHDGPVTYTGEGSYTVEFRSADVAGNVEGWQSVSFEVVEEDDGVEPPPAEGTVCERNQGGATFPDAPGSGHRAFIDCLAELGIVQGYEDGTFGPRDDVSRGQLASFVVRAIELATGETMETGGQLFPDVGPNSTHGPAIYKLRNAGIIQGYEDGTFRPRDSVSREQTARYVVNALEYVTGSTLERSQGTFPDVAAGSLYAADIDKLVTAGILRGFEDGTFGPREPVTRAQMTRFIGAGLEVLDREGAYAGP